jgi:hypothetical protein
VEQEGLLTIFDMFSSLHIPATKPRCPKFFVFILFTFAKQMMIPLFWKRVMNVGTILNKKIDMD